MISTVVTLAVEFPRQSIFSGVMQGLTYGVIAIGLILIYRSTRVINFAIVEMGAFAAALLARLVINWGVDYWVALPVCVIAGGLLGAGIELVIVRRLFRSPRVVLFVATIGLAQLLHLLPVRATQVRHLRPVPDPLHLHVGIRRSVHPESSTWLFSRSCLCSRSC